MKYTVAGLVALPLSWAFTATVPITGPLGKAAASREEDLMLTLRIIMDHEARSTTVSKEQYISQMQDIINKPAPTEAIDLLIPYDAAARLAYAASDKSMKYDDFKAKYEADTVAYIKAKQPKKEESALTEQVLAESVVVADVSVPYDAAAKLAYEGSDKSMDYPSFKAKYESDSVAYVKAKQPKKVASVSATKVVDTVDLRVPIDAAAQLAFAGSDKTMSWDDFKARYIVDTVAMVTAKKLARQG